MHAFRTFSVVVLAVYALLVLAPVGAFAISAFGGGFTAGTWIEAWRQTTQTRLLLNSLTLSALTAGAATLLGVPVGFLLARTDVAGRRILIGLCAAPLFLPPFVWAIAWQTGLASFGLQGMGGAVFVMTLALFPIVALLASVGFAHVDPTLEDDVRTLGGEAHVFWYATLPLVRPLIMTGALFVFILTLSEFGVPALMQVNVYPVAVYIAFSAFYDFAQAAVLCLPFVAVTVALAGFMHMLTRDVDFSSFGEQGQARRIALGRWRLVASMISFAVLGVALGVPIGSLVAQAGDGAVWENAREPLLWSLGLSFIGATLLTFFGLLMAWLCQRDYAPGGVWWLHGQLVLFALPSTLYGLGLVGLLNRPSFAWIYGTASMILVGFFARFVPLLVRAFGAFLQQIPKDGEEAMWMDGGGVWTTFTRFIIPVSRRTLAWFWIIGFILCMGELATTILVTPPGIQTLAVRLFTIEANAPQAHTASLALALIAACLTPLLIGGVILKKESSI